MILCWDWLSIFCICHFLQAMSHASHHQVGCCLPKSRREQESTLRNTKESRSLIKKKKMFSDCPIYNMPFASICHSYRVPGWFSLTQVVHCGGLPPCGQGLGAGRLLGSRWVPLQSPWLWMPSGGLLPGHQLFEDWMKIGWRSKVLNQKSSSWEPLFFFQDFGSCKLKPFFFWHRQNAL